jgi:hypothetical protein
MTTSDPIGALTGKRRMAMAKFTVTHLDGTTEEVTAQDFTDEPGKWIDFRDFDPKTSMPVTVLRVRAEDVKRVEQHA